MASTLQPPISAAPGINGTICPPRTPWHLDTDHADYIGKMAPQGASMGNKSYTNDDFVKAAAAADAKSPKGKAIVFYEPGTLTGNGAGATSTPALQKVGRAGRESNVLFYPAQGIGPTKSLLIVGKGARFYDMRSVTIAGVIGGTDGSLALLQSAVQDFYLWRSMGGVLNGNAVAGMPMKNFGYVECAVLDAKVANNDSSAFRSVEGGPFSGLILWHNFINATYRLAGSSTHTDTVQLSGYAAYGDVDDRGNIMVCATNQGFIIGGAYNVRMRGGVKIAGTRGFIYSPVPNGGDKTVEQNWPTNGGGVAGGLTVEDEVWIGSAKGVFAALAKVVNTIVSIRNSETDRWPGFKYDPSLNTLTQAQLFARWPKPTMASLMALWNTGAIVIPEEPEDPENPTPTLPPAPAVTITSPADGGTVKDLFTISASAIYDAAAPQKGIASARVLVGGSQVGAMVYDATTTSWKLQADSKKYPNGKYSYTVEMTPANAADSRKFTATRSITISNGTVVVPPPVDQTKPVVAITQPAHGGAIFDGPVVIKATATDEAAMDRVELYATGAQGEVRVGTDFKPGVPPLYTLETTSASFPDGTPHPDGSQITYRVRAVDAAGNDAWTAPRVAILKRPDNEAPHVTLTSPAPGFILTPGAPLHLEGTASDALGIQVFEFRDQDGNALASGRKRTDSNIYEADITTPDALRTVEAYAEDPNRNASASAPIPVVYVPVVDLPDEETGYTTVVWSANIGGVDGTDENLLPDETFATGSVIFTPTVDYTKLPDIQVPRTIILGQANVPLVNGVLRGPDGSPGVRVLSLYDDPRFQPTGVQWRVDFVIEGKPAGALPTIYINARMGETIDLSKEIGAAVQPGTVTVVSHDDRLAVEAMTAQVRADMLQIESRLVAGTMYWLLDEDGTPFWFIAAQEPPGSLVWELDAEGRPYWTKKEETE